jgi:hypothetical protein
MRRARDRTAAGLAAHSGGTRERGRRRRRTVRIASEDVSIVSGIILLYLILTFIPFRHPYVITFVIPSFC